MLFSTLPLLLLAASTFASAPVAPLARAPVVPDLDLVTPATPTSLLLAPRGPPPPPPPPPSPPGGPSGPGAPLVDVCAVIEVNLNALIGIGPLHKRGGGILGGALDGVAQALNLVARVVKNAEGLVFLAGDLKLCLCVEVLPDFVKPGQGLSLNLAAGASIANLTDADRTGIKNALEVLLRAALNLSGPNAPRTCPAPAHGVLAPPGRAYCSGRDLVCPPIVCTSPFVPGGQGNNHCVCPSNYILGPGPNPTTCVCPANKPFECNGMCKSVACPVTSPNPNPPNPNPNSGPPPTRRRADESIDRLRKRRTCERKGWTMCPIESEGGGAYGRSSSFSNEEVFGVLGGWECVDISSRLDVCGGCSLPLPGLPQGVDCSALEGTESVQCLGGRCVVERCERGWVLDSREGGGGCQKIKKH